ncbi:MAG: hypothetical protein QOF28_2051, partial [Actinomycetota bacterium]|nr:hypothetical protein [Actinomycetota bacterium]
YYLCIGFLAAVGAAELMRIVMKLARRAYDWIREGDILDALERDLPEPSALDEPASEPLEPLEPRRVESVRVDLPVLDGEAGADESQEIGEIDGIGAAPDTWSYTEHRDPEPGPESHAGSAVASWKAPVSFDEVEHAWRRRIAGVVTLLVLLAAVVVPTVWWTADHEGVAPAWASWNYEGYQEKSAWPEFRDVISTMGKLPPGRALWEPSSDINNYGTTLALELLPYFTHGRIGSMEGLYFESSMTTDFHFLTVSELTAAGGASNPVRGLVYGTIEDFDKGVQHLRMLGVRYFMAQSPDAKSRADHNAGLRHVASVADLDGQKPSGWKIYEVKGWNLAEALQYEPVVVPARGGTSSQCFGTPAPSGGQHDPELAPWECVSAPWWVQGNLDRPFAADGPDQWARAATVAAAAKVTPRPLPKVTVGPVDERVDSISFHVSHVGVPVVVKTSYFPNWKVKGARGPWRLAPNLMVVVPTSHDVKLTYGLTTGDRAGRVLTAVGLLGIVALARMWPASKPVEREPVVPSGEGEPEPLEPEGAVPQPYGRPDESEDGDEPDEEAGRPDEVPALP